MRVRVIAATIVGASALAMGLGGWSRLASRGCTEFDRTQMYIEYNATDGDVGMQVSMDGEPWKELKVFNPAGKVILEIKGKKSLAKQGLTELFFESSEPPLTTTPLAVFLARFPAGFYEFEGKTIDGDEIEGTAQFTHAIPDEPVVTSPANGSVQNPASTAVSWLPVPNPPGSAIIAYQVTVTQVLEALPKRVFSVHVPAGTLSVTVPPEFLQHDAEYEFEVLAIEAGFNQTIHAGAFTTTP